MELLKTKSYLEEKTRVTITSTLQERLADAIDLALQTKNAHWNIKGPNFIALHKFFDELNEVANSFVDTIAERIVQIGGYAEGSIQNVAKKSRLPKAPQNTSNATEIIAGLTESLAKFAEYSRKAIEQANQSKDYVTADIFIRALRKVDKELWMVSSHLDVDPKH